MYKVSRRKPRSKPRHRRKTGKVLNLSLGVPNGIAPLAKIKFANQYEGTLATTADDIDTFNANSAYDFKAALGGEQPPNYDILLNTDAWIRYRVMKLDTKTTFVNLGSVPIRVAIYLSDHAVDMSNLGSYELQSSDRCKSTILTPSGGSKDAVTLRQNYDFVKLYGEKLITEQNYKGAYNGNPSDVIYFYVVAQSLDGTTAVNVSYSLDAVQHTVLEDQSTSMNHYAN